MKPLDKIFEELKNKYPEKMEEIDQFEADLMADEMPEEDMGMEDDLDSGIEPGPEEEMDDLELDEAAMEGEDFDLEKEEKLKPKKKPSFM